MKQKTFYSFMLASVITLATGLLVSCEKDLCKDNPSESNSYITFSEPEIENMISTRTLSTVNEAANPAIVERATLRSEKGDSMRLRVTEEDFFTMRGEKADKTLTRGSLVTSASGITTFGVSCSVYPSAGTYTSYGCGAYFYKESATANTPTSYFWPTSDYKVSFFAYYPYNNAAFTVSSSAATTGSPVYAYTVPSTNANQVDVMTAQVTDHLAGSQGTLALTFSHNCAAIKINITNDSGDAITVNSVAIEGVEYSGTLHDGTWTLSGNLNSSSTNPFSLSYGSAIADGATADITGSSNIFIMLPQTLTSSAKLKIVTSDDTFETTISGSWMAGKTYTYSITKEADGAIDLSMVDNAGNERASMTTANCYLVHAAGKYKIPLVYGNAIKNGENNVVAYYPGKDGSITNGIDRFVNHAGTGISGPWITKSTSGTGVNKGMGVTVNGAELLWQDASGLISAVGIDGDYLTFTVPAAASSKAGNALIAAKSGSTIVWSWHIWVTTETLASTTIVATGSHNYMVSSVNLGWIPTGGSGKQGYCTYYQWGRKDPFIPASTYKSNRINHPVYDISNGSLTGYSYSTTGATIADNIKNPTTHYYYVDDAIGPVTTTYYNMWDAQNTETDNVTSATKKTIYDPCPPGFCVPTGNLWYYFGGEGDPTTENIYSDSNWDSTNKGKTWTLNGENIYFPASGERIYNAANLRYVGSIGDYWSASPGSSSTNKACGMSFRNDWWRWYNNCYRASGFPVRPVAEE
jgi:hypothetical protein